MPIPVAERHGLIFVQASPGGAIDVDELLDGLGPEFASYGFANYSHYKTATLAKDMNWKLVIDTFLETWHVVGAAQTDRGGRSSNPTSTCSTLSGATAT